jgi:hypothetical protein
MTDTNSPQLEEPVHDRIGSRRRKGLRWVALGGTLGVATVAVAGWYWFGRGDTALPHRHPKAVFTLQPLNPKDTAFSFGTSTLRESGKFVQVVSVEPVMSSGIEYLGAFTVWPRDIREASQGGPGFPEPTVKDRHQLTEVVPAAETSVGSTASDPRPYDLTIVLGFRIRSGDIGAVNGVQVNYRVNGEMRHKFFPYAVIGCVQPNPCEAPKGDSQWEDEVLHNLGLAPKP